MHVLGNSSFYVSQSGVLLVAWFGVLASTTVVIVVEITAMSPAVIGIVVSPLGPGGALAPDIATRLLACWWRGLCGEACAERRVQRGCCWEACAKPCQHVSSMCRRHRGSHLQAELHR